MSKKSKKSKKLSHKKLSHKKLLHKMNEIFMHIKDHETTKSPTISCEPKEIGVMVMYNEKIEKEIIDYLDLSLEYSDNISNVKIDCGPDYINIHGYKVVTALNSPSSITREEHFSMTFDIKGKYMELQGSIFDDSRIRMEYKKLIPYIDKVIDLKKKIDMNNFMNNFMKLYDISGLSREKSLKDLDLGN